MTTEHVMTTSDVLAHHLQAFGAGDVDELLADYTEESVLLTPDGPVRGLEALNTAFTGFFTGLFAPGTFTFGLDSQQVEGDTAYIVFHADCASADIPLASDTFLVRDGKIVTQTFVAKIDPK